MLEDLLNLTSISVIRETKTQDGYGGVSTITTTTTLNRGAIWNTNTNTLINSNKIQKESTHVLVSKYGDYNFNKYDTKITWNGFNFVILGNPDNIMNKNEIILLNLKEVV